MITTGKPLLEVSGLSVDFRSPGGPVRAVRGIDFALQPGESMAILGESGSGKSVTGKALLGLLPAPAARVRGSIRFEGREIVGRAGHELRDLRGPGVGMVFQDALDSLNPVFSVGSQLAEIFRVRLGWSRSAARAEAVRLLDQVGIPSPESRVDDYPYQFSGGMRQRVCIAMAIALKPKLLVADEPTTALDVTVQAGILSLVNRLRDETGMALLFVTHDLNVARLVADRVTVIYAGRIVEQGPIEQVYGRPAHPYTKALLASHPAAATHWSQLRPIGGNPPDKAGVPPGCAFHPRCPIAQDRCAADNPDLREVATGRHSACHFALEVIDAAPRA
jgi:oligopeptide transport system ATP-binding protein